MKAATQEYLEEAKTEKSIRFIVGPTIQPVIESSHVYPIDYTKFAGRDAPKEGEPVPEKRRPPITVF